MLVTIQFLTLIILVAAILYNIFPTIEAFSCVDDLYITKLTLDADKDEYHTDIIKSSDSFNINNIYNKCTNNPTKVAKELIINTDPKYASIDPIVRYKGGTTRGEFQDIGTYDCLIDDQGELEVMEVYSVGQCADECDKNQKCKGFKYNKKTNMCITTKGSEINKQSVKIYKKLGDYCVTYDNKKDTYAKNKKTKKTCGGGKNETWVIDGGEYVNDWKKKFGADKDGDYDEACKDYCSRYENDIQDTMTYPDKSKCYSHIYNKEAACYFKTDPYFFHEGKRYMKNNKTKAECKLKKSSDGSTNEWIEKDTCLLNVKFNVGASKDADKIHTSNCKNKLYVYNNDGKINDEWKNEGGFIYYPKNEKCFNKAKSGTVCSNPCYRLTANELIKCNNDMGYHIGT